MNSNHEEMTKLKPCPFCGGTNVKMYSENDPSLHGFIHICEVDGDGMVKIESRLFQTEEQAIEAWNRRAATEKETPKKPVKSTKARSGMGYDFYDWLCPTCGRFLAFECDANRIKKHHCMCGQAIDWTEEKKE